MSADDFPTAKVYRPRSENLAPLSLKWTSDSLTDITMQRLAFKTHFSAPYCTAKSASTDAFKAFYVERTDPHPRLVSVLRET